MSEAPASQSQPAQPLPRLFVKVLVTLIVASGAYVLTDAVAPEKSDPSLQLILSFLLGGSTLLVQYLVDLQAAVERQSTADRRSEEKEAYRNLEEPDSLKILMDLNQRQIEGYHDIVTRQARQSYRSAQIAMWAGIFMLASCLYVGLRNEAIEIKAFAAAMGTAGGAITGYFSKTYLAVYRETLSQLNRFFDQPVTNGYFLAAERLSSGDPALRERIVAQILLVSAGRKPADAPGSSSRTGTSQET